MRLSAPYAAEWKRGKKNMYEELLKKAKEAESVDELIALAEKENIALKREEAESLFSRLKSPGALKDDELDAVSGGGCGGKLDTGLNLNVGTNELYTGRTVYLKNEGHCFGASSNYKPSISCLKPGCYSKTFHIIKAVDDNGTYLIGCNNCDWTYWAKKENIV